MRWVCAVLVCIVGCTSAWERHQALLAEHEQRGQYTQAAAQARWLADNAILSAPDDERSPAADAVRFLTLARLAGKAGNTNQAVEALRQALASDPTQAERVRAQLAELPLSAAQREVLGPEFAWNIMVLAPGASVGETHSQPACW